MLVLLLVLLDPDEVLPPQILGHVACCIRVMGQCLSHLMGNHREDEDDVDDGPPLLHVLVYCPQNCEARELRPLPEGSEGFSAAQSCLSNVTCLLWTCRRMNKLCFGGSVDGLDVLDGIDGLLGVHHRRGQVRLVDAEEGLF